MSPRQVRTACPLDCPDACSLLVTVEEQQLLSIDGDRRNTYTDGFICNKVRRFGDHANGPERILRPGLRIGARGEGKFRDVGWDEALDHIVARLSEIRDRAGAEAILPFSYGGSNGLLTEGSVDRRFFQRLGASNLERTVCAAPTGRAHAGLYGRMPGVDLRDYEHAQLIVVWGFNPSASGIHLVPRIKQARAAGAKLVVVDPRTTPLAKSADLHLAVRPGTDVVLAMAVIHQLFARGHADSDFLARHATGVDELRERAAAWDLPAAASVTGISASDLERFVELYAASSPAVIRCGWGLERNRNGGSAVASVLALPAVAGKFGVRGGGFTMSQGRAFPWRVERVVQAPLPEVRSINMNQLGPELLERRDPAIEALFVYDANPLATIPDQVRVRRGLERDDLFVVVFDQVHTDTARYADVVLPATTFLEHRDLTRGYGASVLNHVVPALPPHAEARPNYAVFAELIERMGLHQPGDLVEPNALVREATASLELGPDERANFEEHGVLERRLAPRLFIDRGPATDDGKVHLVPPELDTEAHQATGAGLYAFRPDPATQTHPLTLISPATSKTVSSTLGQLVRGPACIDVHPDDARSRGIHSGARVRVFNADAEILCRANVTPGIRPGVVSLPKGLWCRHTDNGNTSNAVCPASLADLGRGATFNDARVQLEACPDATKSSQDIVPSADG